MVEKDIGKIQKNDNTDILVRLDDFGGKPGVTIREYVTSERYTGFTKAGTRIPADKFLEFRELLNKVKLDDLKTMSKVKESKEKSKEESSEESEE
ncbi:MAG: hypothetical protein ABIH72_01985 [archaeon]